MNLREAQSTAVKLLIGLLILVTLFHVGVIVRWIPYDRIGGGRLTSDAQMYLLTGVAILANGFLLGVLLAKGNFIRHRVPPRFIRVTLWVFLVFFLLNTVGNLLAKTVFEQSFAILTLLFVVLLAFILKSK